MSNDRGKIRFGLWYDFRNPAQWRQPADRFYREILDQIAWGENNGFDDVWLSEHHFIEDGYLPSMLPAAAAIAARTKRIRIPLGVLLMPFHNPVRLAEDIAVVDAISGGRFELGVGVGYKVEEFEGFAVPFNERGGRTNEALDIIRKLLDGERSPSRANSSRSTRSSSRPSRSRNRIRRLGSAASHRPRCAGPRATVTASPRPTPRAKCTTVMSPNCKSTGSPPPTFASPAAFDG